MTAEDIQLLTVDEAAEALQVPKMAIYRRQIPGLKVVKVGRRVRIPRASVAAIAAGRAPSGLSGASQAPSDAPDADERERLASALGNALVRLLADENLMTINVINDKLAPALNRRWEQLLENWDPTADDNGADGPGDDNETDEE